MVIVCLIPNTVAQCFLKHIAYHFWLSAAPGLTTSCEDTKESTMRGDPLRNVRVQMTGVHEAGMLYKMLPASSVSSP